jgi:hypothetical protein
VRHLPMFSSQGWCNVICSSNSFPRNYT